MKRSNMTKRFFTLMLALLLTAACVQPAFGAEPGFVNFQNRVNSYTEGMFLDVEENWYTEYVAAVY